MKAMERKRSGKFAVLLQGCSVSEKGKVTIT